MIWVDIKSYTDNRFYYRSKTFSLRAGLQVKALILSPGEEHEVLTTKNYDGVVLRPIENDTGIASGLPSRELTRLRNAEIISNK